MTKAVVAAWQAREKAQEALEEAVARDFPIGLRVYWHTSRGRNTYPHVGQVLDVSGERVKVRNLETESEQWVRAMTLCSSQTAPETAAHLPGDGTRRAAFNEWWQMMWKDNDPRSSPGFDEQMRSWSLDAWQAGAAHERDRIAAMRSAQKASGEHPT